MIKTYNEFIYESSESDEDKFMDVIQKIKSYIHSNKMIRDEDYKEHRLTNLLYHNKIRDLLDKRAFKIFHKKPFFRQEEDNIYTSFVVAYTKKGSNKGYHSECIILYEMSTPNGRIFFTLPKKDMCSVFTSHFFNRYYQRVFNTNTIPHGKEKINCIKDLINGITLQMVSDDTVGVTPTKNKTFICKFIKGAGLGNYYYYDGRLYLLFKTFISNDMLNRIEKDDIQKYIDFAEKEKREKPIDSYKIIK